MGELVNAGTASGVLSSNGYATIPLIISGARKNLVIQWGTAGIAAGATSTDVAFPIAFPAKLFAVFATDTGAASISYGTTNRGQTGFSLVRQTGATSGNVSGFYFAIGA